MNILGAVGNLVLMLSPVVFFLPTFRLREHKWSELELLTILLTLLLFLGVASNYDYYWRYYYPLLPFYALLTPGLVQKRKRLFLTLLILGFIVIFPVLAIWNCPVSSDVTTSLLCRIRVL